MSSEEAKVQAGEQFAKIHEAGRVAYITWRDRQDLMPHEELWELVAQCVLESAAPQPAPLEDGEWMKEAERMLDEHDANWGAMVASGGNFVERANNHRTALLAHLAKRPPAPQQPEPRMLTDEEIDAVYEMPRGIHNCFQTQAVDLIRAYEKVNAGRTIPARGEKS